MANHKEVVLYIVRHGECLGNVKRQLLDPFEDLLTDVGKSQAEQLGDFLKSIPFNRVYASDFPRTAETCRGILRKSENCSTQEINLDPRIRERGYSGMFGASFGDAMKILTESLQSGTPYLKVEMPKSEKVEEYENRIISFFTELTQTLRDSSRKDESVLIVSHGLTIQRLVALLNTCPTALGLHSWTKNIFAEKVMRNTNYHKIILKISPLENGSSKEFIVGHVEDAHCRDHLEAINDEKPKKYNVDYKFLDEENGQINADKQKLHYCSPV